MYTEFWKEKLVSDSKEVIADVEALIKLTAEDLSEKGVQIRERLNARLNKAQQQLKDAKAVVAEKASQGAEATDEAVRSNVYTSIGIAAAAGIVIGIMIGRR